MKNNTDYSSLFSSARVGGRLAQKVPAKALYLQLDGLPAVNGTEKDSGNIEFLRLDGGLYCFTMFEASRLAGFSSSQKMTLWRRSPKAQVALRSVSSPSLPLKINLYTLDRPDINYRSDSTGLWHYTGRTLTVVSFEEAVLFWQHCAECLGSQGTTAKNLLIFLKSLNSSLYELADLAFIDLRDTFDRDYSDDVLDRLNALKDGVSQLSQDYSHVVKQLELQGTLLDLQTERLSLSGLNQNQMLLYFQFLLSALTKLNCEDNQQVKQVKDLTHKLSDIQSLHASTTARYARIVDEISHQISEMSRCRQDLTPQSVKQEWTKEKLAQLVGLDCCDYVPSPDLDRLPHPIYKNFTDHF